MVSKLYWKYIFWCSINEILNLKHMKVCPHFHICFKQKSNYKWFILLQQHKLSYLLYLAISKHIVKCFAYAGRMGHYFVNYTGTQRFIFLGLNNKETFLKILLSLFILVAFKPIILITKGVKFIISLSVICTSIYYTLSYPLDPWQMRWCVEVNAHFIWVKCTNFVFMSGILRDKTKK